MVPQIDATPPWLRTTRTRSTMPSADTAIAMTAHPRKCEKDGFPVSKIRAAVSKIADASSRFTEHAPRFGCEPPRIEVAARKGRISKVRNRYARDRART